MYVLSMYIHVLLRRNWQVGSDEKFRARNPLFLELLSARAESYFQENFQKVSNISGNFPGKLAIFLEQGERGATRAAQDLHSTCWQYGWTEIGV